MKKITVGILAHVDAGKTTLSEAMLYKTGTIRKLGRVDKKDAFFDTDAQERERGITIFSKQARMTAGETEIMLLDTPGHVDFSSEMERTLQVLDYAILVISGKDGVQGHTATLWKLLRRYEIPAFIFVNKMDLETADRDRVYANIRGKLGSGCVDFTNEIPLEETASCSEELIEEFFESGELADTSILGAIKDRQLFPCVFGSALRIDGVDRLLELMDRFTEAEAYPEDFGAMVYKITRDDKGTRLTHMKITGGVIRSRMPLGEEKVDQIRIYSGDKFRTAGEADAGSIVAVTGLDSTRAGQCLGSCEAESMASLEPALVYDVICPPQQDIHDLLGKLSLLEEEDPQLHIKWNDQLKSIQISLMGQVQLEILKNLVSARFGIDIDFGEGRIAYKETIRNTVLGAGHFEPLRHYAEIQLLMEPAPAGSGINARSICPVDVLDKNWQRLAITHVLEREHPGVLMGAPLTDVIISIAGGRAHEKHTEGGDFRQAVYRAIRQGLMKADCELLEPWYSFTLEVPQEVVGTAMSDIQRMSGSFELTTSSDGTAVLHGSAPVSEMKDYQVKVHSYTKGHGHLLCTMDGYRSCHDRERVLAEAGYDPARDAANPADSIFCTHGAGYSVPWDEVDEMLHTSVYVPGVTEETTEAPVRARGGYSAGDEDFSHPAFVKAKPRQLRNSYIPPKEIKGESGSRKIKPQPVLPEYLLVDGYNIIFAWEDLKSLSEQNIDAARDALIEMMQNYQGVRKCDVILVFDAYKVKGGVRKVERHDNVTVVYTKEAETADAYIEKTTYELKGKYRVRVATSDRLEQLIIMGNDALKISADEFRKEVEAANRQIRDILAEYSRKNAGSGNRIRIKKIRD